MQIWLFPKKKDIAPRYDQRTFDPSSRHNQLQIVVSPDENDDALWINQDAWFSLGQFDKNRSIRYTPKKIDNGLYLFILKGKVEAGGEILENRDALGVSAYDELNITALEDAEILFIDVPMLH